VQTYRDAGEYTKALDSAQESARRFPDSAQMNFLLGTQLQGLGQFEQSRPYFEKALSLVPNFGEAYAALGELAARQADYQQAVEFYKKAVSMSPQLASAIVELANAHRKLGDLRSAQQVLTTASEKEPENARYHLLLSQVYLQEKQYDRSRQEKQAFLELTRKAASSEVSSGSSHN